jgi:hypothetical protein
MVEFGHGAKLLISHLHERYFVVGNKVTVSFREVSIVCLFISSFLSRYLFRDFLSFPSFVPFFLYSFLPSFTPSIRLLPSFSSSFFSFIHPCFQYVTAHNFTNDSAKMRAYNVCRRCVLVKWNSTGLELLLLTFSFNMPI